MIENDVAFEYARKFMPLIIALSIIIGICLIAIIWALCHEYLGKTGKSKKIIAWFGAKKSRVITACSILALIIGVSVATPLIVYGTKTANAENNPPQTQVLSLNIVHTPDKTTYIEEETFDSTGMIILATFSDGTTEYITDYEIDKTGENKLSISDTYVNITYQGFTIKQSITVRKLLHLDITEAGNYTVEAESLYDDTWVIQEGREGQQYESTTKNGVASNNQWIGSISAGSIVGFKFKVNTSYYCNIVGSLARYENNYNLAGSCKAYIDETELTIPAVTFGHTDDQPYTTWRDVDFGEMVVEAGIHEFKMVFTGGGCNMDCFKVGLTNYKNYDHKTADTPDNTDGKLFKLNNNYFEVDRSGSTLFKPYTGSVRFYLYDKLSADKDTESLGYLVLKKAETGYILTTSDGKYSAAFQGEDGNIFLGTSEAGAVDFENILAYELGNNMGTISNVYMAAQIISNTKYVEDDTYVYDNSAISNIADTGYVVTISENKKLVAPQAGSNPFYYNTQNEYIEIDRNCGENRLFTDYTNYAKVYFYNSNTGDLNTDSLGYLVLKSDTVRNMPNVMNSGHAYSSDFKQSFVLNGGGGNVFSNSKALSTLQNIVNYELKGTVDLNTLYVAVQVVGDEYIRTGFGTFVHTVTSDISGYFQLMQ